MKALIRDNGETVLETAGIDGIDWTTGAPLTNPVWAGGPYTMVQNYVAPTEEEQEEVYEEIAVEPEPAVEENEDDYVIIDGKRYSKEELRSLL